MYNLCICFTYRKSKINILFTFWAHAKFIIKINKILNRTYFKRVSIICWPIELQLVRLPIKRYISIFRQSVYKRCCRIVRFGQKNLMMFASLDRYSINSFVIQFGFCLFLDILSLTQVCTSGSDLFVHVGRSSWLSVFSNLINWTEITFNP